MLMLLVVVGGSVDAMGSVGVGLLVWVVLVGMLVRGAVGRGAWGRGRVHRDDGTAHVPPPHEGTLHMGNNPCRLAADMV